MSEPYLLRLKDLKSKNIRMILTVHEIYMIVARSKKDCDWLHSAWSEVFQVNIFSEFSWCTGCSFKRGVQKGTLSLSIQTAFIYKKIVERLLRAFSMSPFPAAASCR